MSYDIPTADQVIERFPEFTDSDEGQIANAIELAATFVDTNWSEKDYFLGIAYLTAHFLTLAEMATANSAGGGSGDMFVRSVGFGERRIVFDTRSAFQQQSAAATDFASTTYGQMYQRLLTRNVAGIAII